MRIIGMGLVALSLLACEPTKECKRLERVLAQHEEVLHQAKRRAGQGAIVEKRMQDAKANADKAFADLGLDQDEKSITKTLEARAKEHGATVERGTREIEPQAAQQTPGGGSTETQWTFRFSATSDAAAWEKVEKLIVVPPLTQIVGLYPKGKRAYELEVVRGIVDRAPMKVEPTPLTKLEDPARVKSEFGFCGADDLRKKIAVVDAEIETLREDAEALTVNLPLGASWEGLWRRAELVRDIETESRRILREVIDAANRARVDVAAAGVENGIVIVEVGGGKKGRGRIEREMPQALVEQMQSVQAAGSKVERLMIVNRTAEKKRQSDDKMRKALEERLRNQQP